MQHLESPNGRGQAGSEQRHLRRSLHGLIAAAALAIASLLACSGVNPGGKEQGDTPTGSPPSVAATAVVAAPASPAATLEYDENCGRAGCHADFEALPHRHTFGCDNCHEATAEFSEHEFRLVQPSDDVCGSCHDPEDEGRVVHEPFGQLKCLECHDPHGGSTSSFVLDDTVEKLCRRCHEPTEAKVLHQPFKVGECLACHEAHHSDHDHLLVGAPTPLCNSCHEDVKKSMDELPFTHGPAAVDCTACHVSHGAPSKMFLKMDVGALCQDCHDSVLPGDEVADVHVHGALTELRGCSECHTPHASYSRSQLREPVDKLCFRCHNRTLARKDSDRRVANISAEISKAKFKHGPVQTGDCQNCHAPHVSRFASLLRDEYPPDFYMDFSAAAYKLCFGCHEKTLAEDERTTTLTRFRDGDLNLHYTHVNREKGRTCRACHAVHASDLPAHIRKTVPFGPQAWDLPIGFQKTETGGTCTPACHKEASYVNSAAKTASATALPTASEGT